MRETSFISTIGIIFRTSPLIDKFTMQFSYLQGQSVRYTEFHPTTRS